jgi:two-component system nitrogen regulation sensor histidine kinase NtrY
MSDKDDDVIRRGAPRVRNLEASLFRLVLIGGAPAVGIALYLVWTRPLIPELRLTLSGFVLAVWLVCAFSARQSVRDALNVVANLLGALREGDYSIRGLKTRSDSSMALVMREVNDLGSTLQRQRIEALESTALLTHVTEEIAVAVFAFDPAGKVLLVNKAGERLLGAAREKLVGMAASTLGFDEYLIGESRRLSERTFGGRLGRYEIWRAVFYREGRPHQLVVMTDLSQALRDEEQAAWQRIVRVLSHEINNSLTPIKSIAHSVNRMIDRTPPFPGQDEVQHGLSLIEERSGALGRFLRAYAQLAQLPKPRPKTLEISSVVRRIVELEERLRVVIRTSPEIPLEADSDQVEQLLINLVRNAVDAALETGGGVTIGWARAGQWLELTVEDEGKGLPDTSNLFVPFFTTKPQGSGIGLALSRQIAEAHGGSIALENRVPAGCKAIVRLPVSTLQPA